jgi:hypothetical protein
MGHIQHHAIVVTSWDAAEIEAAHAEATRIGLACTSIVEANINSERTFLVGPDGSKSGWAEDKAGDERRDQFKKWLRLNSDGRVEWAEVVYSADDQWAEVVDSPWEIEREAAK